MAKTFEQQAETAKPMSWMATAARLAPHAAHWGFWGLRALAHHAERERNQRDQAMHDDVMGRIDQNEQQLHHHHENHDRKLKNERTPATRSSVDRLSRWMLGLVKIWSGSKFSSAPVCAFCRWNGC